MLSVNTTTLYQLHSQWKQSCHSLKRDHCLAVINNCLTQVPKFQKNPLGRLDQLKFYVGFGSRGIFTIKNTVKSTALEYIKRAATNHTEGIMNILNVNYGHGLITNKELEEMKGALPALKKIMEIQIHSEQTRDRIDSIFFSDTKLGKCARLASIIFYAIITTPLLLWKLYDCPPRLIGEHEYPSAFLAYAIRRFEYAILLEYDTLQTYETVAEKKKLDYNKRYNPTS